MNANEAVVPSADAALRVSVYEQPLNERMRNFLRLDFLYQQAVHHHTKADPWSTRAAVAATTWTACCWWTYPRPCRSSD